MLSYEEPDWDKSLPDADDTKRDRAALRGFRVRWANLRALEAATRSLIAKGLVDPARVGITGLSDGASTVQFAGLHGTLFSVAALSSCCWDPMQDALVGSRGARLYHEVGWPALTSRNPAFWRNMSWVDRPGRVRMPVLMQLADHEYLAAANTVTAMAQAGAPLAAYVFPDEQHVKWLPAHRLAAYQRSLAWFDFWFKPRKNWLAEDASFMADWSSLRSWRSSVQPRPRYQAGQSASAHPGR